MKIISQWTDLAEKHRVLVDVHEDGNAVMLKFQKEPTKGDVEAEVAQIISREKIAIEQAPALELAATKDTIATLTARRVVLESKIAEAKLAEEPIEEKL